MRIIAIAVATLALSSISLAQQDDPVHIEPRVPEKIHSKKDKPKVVAPDTADSTASQVEKAGPVSPGESSSRDTRIDISPPKNDTKDHPDSDTSDVSEGHPWDPHKAQKDVEVGDYYFKRGNYKGALGRYESALTYQDNNTEAMWRAGVAAEKLGNTAKAREYYGAYMKAAPKGEHASSAASALARLSH